MVIEENRMSEGAHFVKSLLGDPGLPRDAGDSTDEGEEHDGRGGDPDLVPLDELRGAIGERVSPRGDRLVLEVTLDIRGKGTDSRIAPRWLLAQRSEDDVVEISPKPALDR